MIVVSMNIKLSDILKVAKEILYTNEKIVIFCIVVAVVIINFIVIISHKCYECQEFTECNDCLRGIYLK